MVQLGSPERRAIDQLFYLGLKLEIQVQFIEGCVGMEMNEVIQAVIKKGNNHFLRTPSKDADRPATIKKHQYCLGLPICN